MYTVHMYHMCIHLHVFVCRLLMECLILLSCLSMEDMIQLESIFMLIGMFWKQLTNQVKG